MIPIARPRLLRHIVAATIALAAASVLLPAASANSLNICVPITTISPLPNGNVFIDWETVAAATLYGVFRSTSASGPFTGTAVSPPTTEFTDTTTVPGVTYFYFVIANPHFGTCPTTAVTAVPFFPGAVGALLAVAGSVFAYVRFRPRA